MNKRKLFFCSICKEITCHSTYGKMAVCLNCGVHKSLDEPYVEAELDKSGDRERRV